MSGGEGKVPMRKRFRHGRWRDFHLYQAFRMGERGCGDIVDGLGYRLIQLDVEALDRLGKEHG